MKLLKIVGASSVLMLGIALSASSFAASITPAGAFTATGSTFISVGAGVVDCAGTFTGTVNADGTASITAARLTSTSPNNPNDCAIATPTGFPWTITANSVTAATISNMNFNISYGGIGGPCGFGGGSFPASWSNTSGSFKFTQAPIGSTCSITATLDTVPKLVFKN